MNQANRDRKAGKTKHIKKLKPLRNLSGGLGGNSHQRRKQRRVWKRITEDLVNEGKNGSVSS